MMTRIYMLNRIYIQLLPMLLVLFTGCERFLEVKPDKTLKIPSSLSDLQALMDATDFLNGYDPGIGEISADNYYLTDADWNSLAVEERDNYIWNNGNTANNQWTGAFNAILIANQVLESLENMDVDDAALASTLKGSALFYRAYAYNKLASVFSPPYYIGYEGDALGLPLRLSPDIKIDPKRSSLKQTYDQIISDLLQAKDLLPNQSQIITRPNKAAAYGLLARVCIAIEDYEKAGLYANSSLSIYNELIDYNEIDVSQAIPFQRFNKEVLFHSVMFGGATMLSSRCRVDSNLYASYGESDLRRDAFFQVEETSGEVTFKGNYDGQISNATLFSGITTAEMYLIRSECHVRSNNVDAGLADLNEFRKFRIKSDWYQPLAIDDSGQLLKSILEERRKELIFRGIRWTDLKRLNRHPETQVTMQRDIENKIYTLSPEKQIDYVILIPHDVVERSNVEQNIR